MLPAVTTGCQQAPHDFSCSPINFEAAARLLHEPDWQQKQDRILSHLAASHMRNDKNFAAAYLHAQFLFLIGLHEEARKMFGDLDKFAPSYFEKFFSHRHCSDEGAWNALYEGCEVQFHVFFNRKGPVAVDVNSSSQRHH